MRDYISREVALKIIYTSTAPALEVKGVPAADVVEVRHASWVWNPDGMDWGIGAWVCGECKSRPETWWTNVKEILPLRCSGSHYCGNCGAKMDGGQDE